MTYSITYLIENSIDSPHTRYYHALNQSMALEMFRETCQHGGLIGEKTKVIKVKKFFPTPQGDSGL